MRCIVSYRRAHDKLTTSAMLVVAKKVYLYEKSKNYKPLPLTLLHVLYLKKYYCGRYKFVEVVEYGQR